MKPADGVGSYETRGWLRKLRSSPSGHAPKPGDFSQRQPFSSFTPKHLLRLADGEADGGGIDPGGLITPAAADFNERNPEKRGLIHLPGLLVLIESNNFICVVNIISWRSSPPPTTHTHTHFWTSQRLAALQKCHSVTCGRDF